MSESLSQHRKRIAAEHRECGKPKYDGCYSHVPMPHCRACGMALPCDVMRIAPALSERDALAAVAEADSALLFRLVDYTRHRPYCPELYGHGDCNCGLYALLDSVRCTCGHKVSVHTDRDVDDVVGWPCSACKSKRCLGFAYDRTVAKP